MPDALDTLAKQQSDNNAKVPPAGARNTLETQTPGEAGAKKDFKPTLDPHPDPIPPDATELTITGHNFDQNTLFYVDNQQMKVKEFALTSLRVGLTATALTGKARVSVMAKNPGANGGDSNVVAINVNAPGG